MANREQPKQYRDLLTAFPYGMNSGVAPLLLPKEQCSFAINTTFRGGYATDRSPREKLSLNFDDDSDVETAVRNGYFQGCGVFRPDYGASQVVAQISGRLFAFVENGDEWDVTEITIPGDPNNSTTSRIWMWQSEKWLIITDGLALPIFYNGVTCRRSYGPSAVLGEVTAAIPAGVNDIGAVITATMTDPYDGPYNVPVAFNGGYYQTSEAAAATTAYRILLENISGIPGGTILAGAQLFVKGIPSPTAPRIIGATDFATINVFASAAGEVCCPAAGNCFGAGCALTNVWQIPLGTNITLTLDSALGDTITSINLNLQQTWTWDTTPLAGGATVTRSYGISYITSQWNVVSVSYDRKTVVLTLVDFYQKNAAGTAGQFIREGAGDLGADHFVYYNTTPLTLVANQVLPEDTTTPPDVLLATFASDFTIPAVGATDTAYIDGEFSGPDDLLVEVNGQQFHASVAPDPAASNTLYLINLSDTTAIPAAGPPGFPQDITSLPEIPICRMGVYGRGQNWFSTSDGVQFGCSDLVASASGTPAQGYRDSVLRTNDLEVMGYFSIPVSGEIITAMIFVPTLDQALGQGPLQIGVPSGMFSCKAPFTLSDFQGITNAVTGDLVTAPILDPILTKSLIGFGPVAHASTVISNSDTIFRSFEGVGSLVLARRNFSDIGGNTPISREMTRTIDQDRKDLLAYSSAIVFDNRLRMTTSANSSPQGVFHMGELVLNYDLISTLRGKAQPVWDGLWTGNNILQYTKGLFGEESRAFAFTFNITDSQIELYELLKTGEGYFDNGTGRIKWVIETPVIFNSDVKSLTDLARLIDGQMYLSDVRGQVDVSVLYRPIFYPCWIDWHSFKVCSDLSASNGKQQVRYALGLGEPDASDCDTINNQPFREAVGFQLRLEITGHCALWGIETLGDQVPRPKFNKPAGDCTTTIPTCLALDCDVEADLDVYSLDGLPAVVVESTQVPNDFVYYIITETCGAGTTLAVVGVPLPAWISFDAANSRFRGAFGTYYADTKEEANEAAQNALDAFVANLIAVGGLVCAADALTLFYDDFEDYTDGVAVNGLGLGDWTDLPSPYVDI